MQLRFWVTSESVDVEWSEFRIGNKWRIAEVTQFLECGMAASCFVWQPSKLKQLVTSGSPVMDRTVR
jgi:hypothetical protein